MKTEILQLLYANPFTWLDHEDPYTYITKFYEIDDAIGALEADEDQVFKRLFQYSLIRKEKEWFMEAKTSIAVFSQGASEALNETWERIKSMLRKCQGHGFDELTQIHIFHHGLQPQPRTLLDATTGGSLMSKNVEEAIAIIDRMTLNDHQGQHNRGGVTHITNVKAPTTNQRDARDS
ncbi:uncharacterized protein LOC127082138 [Lathyrus oleraceus]|uniref:uncharacterized protein LOC127082138 n=1 Tax=Pisum sativum TaxID=3888 RepID=UPI0021CF903E|nr:uncharacterized protein LOC127082138 [Pisum sativum]